MKMRSIALFLAFILSSLQVCAAGLEAKLLQVDEDIIAKGVSLNSLDGLILKYEAMFDLSTQAAEKLSRAEDLIQKRDAEIEALEMEYDATRLELSDTIDKLLKIEEIKKLNMQPMELFFTKQDIRSLLREGKKEVMKKSPIMEEGGSGPVLPPAEKK